MRDSGRYDRLIPMVQGVIDTLDSGIEADEKAAADLARIARAMTDGPSDVVALLLGASRRHAVKALHAQGQKAALLAQYGLA